jgi:CheY-like chemotaxis protein
LLVDDDPEVRRALGRLLALRHDVQVAAGALEALDLVAAGPAFEAVICDVLMPGMNGVEFLNLIQPDLARRLVFLTGGGIVGDLAERLAETGRPMLAKPVTLDDIEQALEACVELTSG